MRTSSRTNNTPGCPIYIGQAQAEEKVIYKRCQRAGGLFLSPVSWGILLSASFGRHALTPLGWIFLLFSKKNRAVAQSCNTYLSKGYNMVCPRPESCDKPRALMSVTPNLCCDKTELRSIHAPEYPSIV